MFKFLLGK